MAHTVFTFGFKCRDHSFVEVVAAHLEKGNLALGTLSQNPRRWDIGLYSLNRGERITGQSFCAEGSSCWYPQPGGPPPSQVSVTTLPSDAQGRQEAPRRTLAELFLLTLPCWPVERGRTVKRGEVRLAGQPGARPRSLSEVERGPFPPLPPAAGLVLSLPFPSGW